MGSLAKPRSVGVAQFIKMPGFIYPLHSGLLWPMLDRSLLRNAFSGFAWASHKSEKALLNAVHSKFYASLLHLWCTPPLLYHAKR